MVSCVEDGDGEEEEEGERIFFLSRRVSVCCVCVCVLQFSLCRRRQLPLLSPRLPFLGFAGWLVGCLLGWISHLWWDDWRTDRTFLSLLSVASLWCLATVCLFPPPTKALFFFPLPSASGGGGAEGMKSLLSLLTDA